MSALTERNKVLRHTIGRLRVRLPDCEHPEALRLLAEIDVLAARLFVSMLDGGGNRDQLSAYGRLVDQRISLLTRLRLLPTLPRAKVSDEEELDPYVQRHIETLRARGEKV